MRNLIVTAALALSMGSALAQAPVNKNHLTGDYLEARTASVFAGACHYNGELTTTGREAGMVWHVREGVWNGTDVSGLSVMASVVSQANLQDASAPRRAVLYVDAKATPAQSAALTEALTAKFGATLGQIAAVKQTPIHFARKGDNFRVEVKGVSKLAVEAMPDNACCKMPQMVWYKPLVEVQNRKVGLTKQSNVKEATLGTDWTFRNQNTSFYGTFSL